MKNFKKVISAVIALAMVISTFTAVSASKFADVADTANYAEAVEVLAALGIVNGTEENGTLVFQAEKEVTRAEAVTMIVGALNMTDDAKASAGTSQFADVNAQAAWASGYVNVGVAQGFIKGYNATTFGPLDNVTYAQLCVMLSSIAGYGDYAAANGGWPTGYTTMAASLGMSKGVSAANDTALTKGQVAIMLYNALQAPMLGVSEFSAQGNTFKQLDGKNGNDFKTILYDKFGGYVATVTIKNTPAADNGLDKDRVVFDVTKADYWNGFEVKASAPYYNEETYFEGVDVNGNLLQTGTAVFVENEDDELVMIYFAPNGNNKVKEFDAADYVYQDDVASSNRYSDTKKQIKFGDKYVKLGGKKDLVEIYVNGVLTKVDDQLDIEAFEETMDAAQGKVTVIESQNGSDSIFSIFLNAYVIAEVTDVDYKAGKTTVSVKKSVFADLDKIVVDDDDIEEGDVKLTVTRNGAAAELADLAKGDVIAVKAAGTSYDAATDTITADGEIEIIATTDKVSGTITKVDKDDSTYTIDGTVYKTTNGTVDVNEIKKTLELTLDPFGRIFSSDITATSNKYAIVLDVDRTSQGVAEEVKLLLADGTTKRYELETSVVNFLKGNEIEAKAKLADRVVQYTIKNATGNIATMQKATLAKDGTTDLDYKAKSGKLGSYAIGDATAIIDASEAIKDGDLAKAANYTTFDADTFSEDAPYQAIVIKDGSDYANLVILTKVGVTFGENARFAVVQKVAVPHTTEDDDDCQLVTVLMDGQSEQELLFNLGKADGLKVGDAFFFETDSYGFVDKVYPFYAANGTFKTLEEAGIIDGHDLQLVHGYIVDVTDRTITFAGYNDGAAITKIDTDVEYNGSNEGVVDFGIASDCEAYLYNINGDYAGKNEYLNFNAKDASSLKASNIAKYESDSDKGVYEASNFGATSMNADLYEAVAIVINGDIVEIYEIQK